MSVTQGDGAIASPLRSALKVPIMSFHVHGIELSDSPFPSARQRQASQAEQAEKKKQGEQPKKPTSSVFYLPAAGFSLSVVSGIPNTKLR